MTLSTNYYIDQIKVNEIGESCSAHVLDNKYASVFHIRVDVLVLQAVYLFI
jgi:hypothetical protein